MRPAHVRRIALQRRTGAGWRTVARVPVGPGGRFRAGAPLAPGRYRAAVAAATGYAPGASAPFSVG
jgi:hypothetical protein